MQFDSETLKPTYRLMIGTPGSSNAIVIAKRLGMPKDVVGKASSLLATESDGTSDLINQIQATREDAERKRSEAQSLLDEAGVARSEAAERLQRVEDEGRRLRGQADREIDTSMQAIRRLMEEFAAEMQNAPGTWSQKAQDLAGKVAELAASTPLAQRHAEFIGALRRGDTVYVVPFPPGWDRRARPQEPGHDCGLCGQQGGRGAVPGDRQARRGIRARCDV